MKVFAVIIIIVLAVFCLCGWTHSREEKPEMITEAYIVQEGDTVYDITKKYMEHASYVNLDCTYSTIYPGQVIIVKYVPEKR